MPTRGGSVVDKKNQNFSLFFLVQNDNSNFKNFGLVPTFDPSPGPKNENLAKKKLGPGEFLIDAMITKIIIRTPQMGQNVHPKVHQKES